MIFKTEKSVYFVDDLYDPFDLFGDLFGGHKDMRVVLREATHPHEPVELPALLVAVHEPQFAHTDGQVFVAVRRKLVHEHSAGAVHGLHSAVLAVDLRRVHIVFIVLPVSRIFPKRAGHDHRRLHFNVALSSMKLTPIVDEHVL